MVAYASHTEKSQKIQRRAMVLSKTKSNLPKAEP